MFGPEFFPTPPDVIQRMLARISYDARYFLDPSAGKGDIAEAIQGRGRYSRLSVDCLELQPELAAILRDKGFPVMGADWLTYAGVSYYDACVMNPPYAQGDVHLLKAWDFLHAGEIVCLLNEETILNPYTATRTRLKGLIDAHGDVEYLGSCFAKAERPTDVRVALVYLKKVAKDDTLDLWATETPEHEHAEGEADPQWLAVVDTLGNMQHYYDMANSHMFQAFTHLRKAALYMRANNSEKYLSGDYDKIAHLAFDNITHARAEFSRLHRKHAWTEVFRKMEFHQWLDKKQTDEFYRDIERDANIPFTKENIKGTLENIWQQRRKLFDISVANVFDELVRYYKGNHAHSEGWKTNSDFKVNRKLIFPWGCDFDKDFRAFHLRWGGSSIDIYNDLDRILCVLSGASFTQCDTVGKALRRRFDSLGHKVHSPFDNKVESQYFDIRFFMKGTVHLTFKDAKLWQEFNVTAAKGKRWLGLGSDPEPEPEPFPPSAAPVQRSTVLEQYYAGSASASVVATPPVIVQAKEPRMLPQTPGTVKDGLALLQAALDTLPLFAGLTSAE